MTINLIPEKNIKMKTFTVILFFLICIFGTVSAQNAQNNSLSAKEVFTEGFPKTLSFRNDKNGIRNDFSYWEKTHLPFKF